MGVLMQSVVTLWYLTVAHALPEAESARRNLRPWDMEKCWLMGCVCFGSRPWRRQLAPTLTKMTTAGN